MHNKVQAVACRTLKINIVFIVAMSVHVTKPVCQIDFYSLLGNTLYEEAVNKLREDKT